MDLFGFKRRRKEKHEDFISNIPQQSDEYLLTAWSALDMDGLCGNSNQYTNTELRMVEQELEKRGYADELGRIYPYNVNEKSV